MSSNDSAAERSFGTYLTLLRQSSSARWKYAGAFVFGLGILMRRGVIVWAALLVLGVGLGLLLGYRQFRKTGKVPT